MQLLGDKIIAAAADLQRLNAGWYPAEKDLMDAVGLENWSILRFPDKSEVLLGSSIDHPQLGSRNIHTSNVLWISDDRKLARTLSRWYRLGADSDEAAHLFRYEVAQVFQSEAAQGFRSEAAHLRGYSFGSEGMMGWR